MKNTTKIQYKKFGYIVVVILLFFGIFKISSACETSENIQRSLLEVQSKINVVDSKYQNILDAKIQEINTVYDKKVIDNLAYFDRVNAIIKPTDHPNSTTNPVWIRQVENYNRERNSVQQKTDNERNQKIEDTRADIQNQKYSELQFLRDQYNSVSSSVVCPVIQTVVPIQQIQIQPKVQEVIKVEQPTVTVPVVETPKINKTIKNKKSQISCPIVLLSCAKKYTK